MAIVIDIIVEVVPAPLVILCVCTPVAIMGQQQYTAETSFHHHQTPIKQDGSHSPS